MTIELRHLRYFLAVAAEGHVTRAAERLGLQQPPLSQQIRALEAALGATLFERHPRGMRLTPAGLLLQREAGRLLAELDRITSAVRRTAAGLEGRLAVGFTGSAAFHPLVTAAIRSFRDRLPDVAVSLQEGDTSSLVADLKAERIDAAFMRAPSHDEPALAVTLLEREAMIVALPGRHRLAEAARPLALRELAGDTFLLYRRASGPGLYDAIIAACRAAGFSPRIGQEAPRLLTTLSLVAAGLGLSIVPASMQRLGLAAVGYAALDDDLTAPLYLAVRRADRAPALARFTALVREG